MRLFFLFFLALFTQALCAQQVHVPWARFTQEEISASLIDQNKVVPLAILPWVAPRLDLDSVWGYAVDSTKYYFWAQEALLSTHFLDLDKNGVKITLDPVIDFALGLGARDTNRLSNNTRGFWAQADIDGKIQFAALFREHGFAPTRYEKLHADSTGSVMGWARRKTRGIYLDAAVSQGWVSFPITKHGRITLGHGKQAFGFGHRQLLISDNAPAFPYASIEWWALDQKLHYRAVWAEMQSFSRKPKGEVPEALFKDKNTSIQMLSYKPIRALELGFAQLTNWQRYEDRANVGDLPFRYESLIPLPFYSLAKYGLEGEGTRSALAGNIALKWKKVGRIYGQYLHSLDSEMGGLQAGIQVFDFVLPHLHLQFEYNQIAPWAYSSAVSYNGFDNQNQAIGSTIGAHSTEYLGKLSYRYKRWFLQAQYHYMERFEGQSADPSVRRLDGLVASQDRGVINYAELHGGYMLNPSQNLQVFVRLVDRNARWNDRKEVTQTLMLGVATQLFDRKTDF